MKHLPLVITCLGMLACGPKISEPETSTNVTAGRINSIQYKSVTEKYSSISGPGPQSRPVSWNELMRYYPEGGFYEVISLEGRSEEATSKDGPSWTAVTYVTLRCIRAWTADAGGVVVARVPGGPVGDGSRQAWRVELREGERVGVFFAHADVSRNAGYRSIDPLALFKLASDGTLSNGQLFQNTRVNPAHMQMLVKAAQAGTSADIYPDVGMSVSASADAGPVTLGVVQGQMTELGAGTSRPSLDASASVAPSDEAGTGPQ